MDVRIVDKEKVGRSGTSPRWKIPLLDQLILSLDILPSVCTESFPELARCFHWMMRHNWGLPVCIYPTTQHTNITVCWKLLSWGLWQLWGGDTARPTPLLTWNQSEFWTSDLKTLERIRLCGPVCHTQRRHWSNVMDAWCKHCTCTFPEPSLGVVWVHKSARLRSHTP